jgi:hypothetical protein
MYVQMHLHTIYVAEGQPVAHFLHAFLTGYCVPACLRSYDMQNIGLEMRVDHTSMNTDDWYVSQISYKSQLFDSIESFKAAYTANTIRKVIIDSSIWERTDTVPNYASMRRRGSVRALDNLAPPQIVYPEGRRFLVEDHSVCIRVSISYTRECCLMVLLLGCRCIGWVGRFT